MSFSIFEVSALEFSAFKAKILSTKFIILSTNFDFWNLSLV